MDIEGGPTDERPVHGTAAEIVGFLQGRSVPCPRCGYDLRDTRTATCAECGEPLVIMIGSPRLRFGWLVLALAPGCFSGVAAVFVLFPIVMTIIQGYAPGQGVPWPVVGVDAFGFLSAGAVWMIYRHRHRVMSWSTHRQAAFAGAMWGVHVLALAIFILSIWLWQ